MSEAKDFETLRSLTPEEIEKYQAARPTRAKAKASKSSMEFVMIPLHVIKTLASTIPALAVVAAITKTHYDDIDHNNPIRLTSACLAEFGISRGQKTRVLKFLEKAGLVHVDRRTGRNPLVTVKWKLRIKD
jgi:hypothetical protein